MVRLLFKIFHRCLRRFHSAQEIIDGFEKPLCAFLVCIGVYLGVWELTRGFSRLVGVLPSSGLSCGQFDRRPDLGADERRRAYSSPPSRAAMQGLTKRLSPS